MKERNGKSPPRWIPPTAKLRRSSPARRCLRLGFVAAWTCAIATYFWALSDIQRSQDFHEEGAYTDGIVASEEWWASSNVTLSRRFMLVVAHPDDECLFFSPTLLNMLRPRRRPFSRNESVHHNASLVRSAPLGHVLSLSSGNAEGLGATRAREMRASCWALGIPSPRCISVDHPALPDSMKIWWPEKTIEELVRVYIEKWGIDLIITFDHYGVSGHANHRAIAAALSRAVHKDPTFPVTMMLQSTSLLQKYSSLLSLPWALHAHHRDRSIPLPLLSRPSSTPSSAAGTVSASATSSSASSALAPSIVHSRPPWTFQNTSHPLATHRTFFISTPWQYIEGRRAFAQHKSQGKWFRRLWLLTSRYMWWNELERVVPVSLR